MKEKKDIYTGKRGVAEPALPVKTHIIIWLDRELMDMFLEDAGAMEDNHPSPVDYAFFQDLELKEPIE